MRVLVRVCVCALTVVAIVPLPADAAPVLPGGTACPSDPSAPPDAGNCLLLAIDPVSATLEGQFTFDNDVALFQFVLGAGEYTFSASTNSYDPGFDPFLALYSRAPGASDASLVVVGDVFARNDNVIDVIDPAAPLFLDAALAFQLTVTEQTEYILALIQAGNEAKEDTLGFTWDDPAFKCAISMAPDCAAGEFLDFYTGATLSGDFSLAVKVTPVDAAPVPEPGTLSLLALGAAGAALARRRRARYEPR